MNKFINSLEQTETLTSGRKGKGWKRATAILNYRAKMEFLNEIHAESVKPEVEDTYGQE